MGLVDGGKRYELVGDAYMHDFMGTGEDSDVDVELGSLEQRCFTIQ